jgi:hypothetical protein
MAGISEDALKRHRISNFQSIIEVDYAAAKAVLLSSPGY